MSKTAIRVKNITKEYTIDYSHSGSFKELVMRKLFPSRQNHIESRKKILALDNLSFEVKKGEALGIIGKNGAGKSTLLKVLSGITRPTSGKIEIFGRMNSILDIGVGFHPELTGRENIFLSGELNGLQRKEIRKRMDEIIDFSGVEKFIDTPVKYYSSGMFLRLAFSVFTGIDSDILLLDEVMSVGDAEFQLKSSRKLQSMFGQGKTIVLVSHNPADIIKFCSRAIFMVDGKIFEDGIPGKLISDYITESINESLDYQKKIINLKEKVNNDEDKDSKISLNLNSVIKNSVIWDNQDIAPGNEFVKVHEIVVRNEKRTKFEKIYIDEKIIIDISLWVLLISKSISIGIKINDFSGYPLFSASPLLDNDNKYWNAFFTTIGQKSLRCTIQEHLLNGSIFSLDIYLLSDMGNSVLLHLPYILTFSTSLQDNKVDQSLYKLTNLPIYPIIKWERNN